MADLIITIDGPAASGKSTAAQLLARRLNAGFLDTGAMYRVVTLAAIRSGADMNDEEKLLAVLDNTEFKFATEKGKMSVCIDGDDASEQIRRPDVAEMSRYIASSPKLRDRLVQMQRQFAANAGKIITEGRDQGTVAFPDADIKFYLTADKTERARRRQLELQAKGNRSSLEKVQKAIEDRDKSDEGRTIGPLKPADDAVVVDTTDLNIEKVLEKLLCCVKEKCSKQS